MTEPTVTGAYKALIERHGTLVVVLTFLRHYWKPIVGTAGVICGFGVFLDKFDTVIQGQKAMIERVARLESAQVNYQAKDDARWEAIHAAADIVVTQKQPAVEVVVQPVKNAPVQEARKGKVIR